MPTFTSRLYRTMASLCRDGSGATAILFGLSLIVVVGFAGAAIDYGRAYDLRNKLQLASDAAALATASAVTFGYEEALKVGRNAFEANYKPVWKVSAAPVISVDDGAVTVSATADLPTVILDIIGHKTMSVGVKSHVNVATIANAEIVLVLDYSGSMDSKGKYQAMRDAAIELIQALSLKGQNDKIKFALVPFSTHVYLTLPSEFVVGRAAGRAWTNCTLDRNYPYNLQDSTPVASDDKTKWRPGVETKKDGKDRDNEPGNNECENYPQRDLVVRPLTSDHQSLVQQLRAMRPYSYTHIALGLEMGWHLISPNPPFTEGVPYGDKDTVKVIVLLTDGMQTVGGNGPGETNSIMHAEKNLEANCATIKSQGAQIITVGFDLDDKFTLKRLQACASKPSYFFDAKTNTALASAFQAIVGKINGELRLTR